MINIGLKIISILIQTTIMSYFLIKVSQLFKEEKFSKKTISVYCVVVLIGLIISTFKYSFSLLSVVLFFCLFSFATFLLLKLSLLKSILIAISMVILSGITELIAVYLFIFILRIDPYAILNSGRITYMNVLILLVQALLIFSVIKICGYLISKKIEIKEYLKNLTPKQIKMFTISLSIYILPQLILFCFKEYSYPVSLLVMNSLQFIGITVFLFIFLKRDIELEKTQSDLFISEIHNKTMVGMVDGVRTLKHDYNNIMQALNGYVSTKQYDKLQEHINKVLGECNVVNNLSVIDPKIFNDPAIYGIIGAKYFIAMEKDIKVDFDIVTSIKDINFPMPELSRILGIFIDNAIEATCNANEKYIRVEMKFDKRKNSDVIRIVNTYDTNISIDLNNIFNKGYSSKEIKSGIGLWEVKKLVNKQSNSQIYATIENKKFVENLIIEKS